jgi:anthranilate phosphoribosyltransferase
MFEHYTDRVGRGQVLSAAEVSEVVLGLVREDVAAEVKAAFLMALAQRGETPAEIAAFARELRDRAVEVQLEERVRAGEILDVVGTGGDRLNTFNLSTTAALLVAAGGVTVAKHGNRAVTSQSGSADLLEALGVRIDLDAAAAGRWLAEHRFAFLFAPKYHPAFRFIAPARRLCAEAGQRTLFNYLGPLLNPARPSAQLMGVPRPELCEPMAEVLRSLGVRRAMVVCGEAPGGMFLDEMSTLGATVVAEFYQDHALSQTRLDLSLLPTRGATIEALRGADPATNALMTRRVLTGVERGAFRDAVLLNAGAAFWVAGAAGSILEGWSKAEAVIESGEAGRYLERLVDASRRASD